MPRGDTDGSTSGTNPFAGRLANFHFTTAGNHCVQTLGGGTGVAQSALRDATLTFEQPSNVRMLCQQGQTPCPGVKVLLPRGSCFHVNCDAESCEDFEVLPLVDGETDFRCYCNCNGGTSCAWTDNYDYCETLTAANSSNPCATAQLDLVHFVFWVPRSTRWEQPPQNGWFQTFRFQRY